MLPTKLIKILEHSNRYTNANLILDAHTVTWDLSLVNGQVVYASDESHPIRRWDRALKQHCPRWDWRSEALELLNHPDWQLRLLEQGIKQEQLSLVRAKLIIRSIFQECLFELSLCTDFKESHKPNSTATARNFQTVALSFLEMRSIQTRVAQLQRQWQSANLGYLSPTLSPTLKGLASSQTLPILEPYLNGQFTLWDLAGELGKSVVEVAQDLVPLAQQRALEFQTIPDLSLSTVKLPLSETSTLPDRPVLQSRSRTPLIACIDDSPVIAHSLKKILAPEGYQVLSIQEPMRGFTQLIEHKPDLILLDLLLPNADGYSICKFLRDTPVFEKTPIIILTGKNSSIDRIRAKMVGATEFLIKPPDSIELLQLLQKHIPN
ncbi:MAG: response regulator [Oscillatoriophycideae cyanobacterium NC_groundwater_1537_Pr4_S-0.65um_50_18]|nr:response regulator [Oscillatoriophycideae cyanobacterium NC_groundwater_1537_Pr4_S-0.65um_50_18]